MSVKLPESVINNARKAMKKDKHYLIPDVYTQSFCERIRTCMDDIKDGVGVEFNYGGTEMRAWSAQKRSTEINTFYNDANYLLSKINNYTCTAGTVLAIKNEALGSNDNENKQGRWHIDSWRSQEKIFLFLNDTDENSGTFEFIPNTNRMSFRLRKALEPGYFFNFSQFYKRNSPRPYQSIDDKKIESLVKKGYKTKPLIVKAGSVLVVNPSYLIHRARPCISGCRYALTAYYSVAEGYKDFDI